MTTSASRPLRILCMHGFGQNSRIFREQLHPIISQLPRDWTFVVPDGPYLSSGIGHVSYGTHKSAMKDVTGCAAASQRIKPTPALGPRPDLKALAALRQREGVATEIATLQRIIAGSVESSARAALGKYVSKLQITLSELDEIIGASSKEDLAAAQALPQDSYGHSWLTQMHSHKGKGGNWIGIDHSLAEIAKVMRDQGPFDGAICFSSGAPPLIQAALALQLPPGQMAASSPTFQPPPSQRPFRFVLSFAAPPHSHPRYRELVRQSAAAIHEQEQRGVQRDRTTCMFLYGVKDTVIPMDALRALPAEVRADSTQIHLGGHVIPTRDGWTEFLSLWVHSFVLSGVASGRPNGADVRRLLVSLAELRQRAAEHHCQQQQQTLDAPPHREAHEKRPELRKHGQLGASAAGETLLPNHRAPIRSRL